MRRTRVSLAGPLSNGETASPATMRRNLRRARASATLLARHGYAPFVPHLPLYGHAVHPFPHAVWLEMDTAWLQVADCVLLLPGWEASAGARQEAHLAAALGLRVYESPAALLAAEPPQREE